MRCVKLLGIVFLLFLSNISLAVPAISAQSWLVADADGRILNSLNINHIRPIASITKLVTAMVIADDTQSLDEVIPTKLFKNITRQELIALLLVHSDNNAARILCESYSAGYAACISAMNEKVKSLGMLDTVFVDSSGLNNYNASTALDLLQLVFAASKYAIIVENSSRSSVLSKKNKVVSVRNTNPLVGNGYDFIVSKTGFISKSGGCIVVLVNTQRGIKAAILLGSKNTKTRISELVKILNLNK